jgi:hypothetical protein
MNLSALTLRKLRRGFGSSLMSSEKGSWNAVADPSGDPRAGFSSGGSNQFARDFILSLVGLIRFDDRARCAVPPRLLSSSCFRGRCGNTVGRTPASPFGAARPRVPGRIEIECNLRTSGHTMASRCGSAYPRPTAMVVSGRAAVGLTDSGLGA